MVERAEAHGPRNIRSRSLHERNSFRARGLLFFLTDTIILLGILIGFRLLRGTLGISVTFFVEAMLLLQFASEFRHPHRSDLSALDETSAVFHRACVAYALASVLALLLESSAPAGLAALAVATVPLLLVGRCVSYAIERSRRRKGDRSRALVVGGGAVADRIVSTFRLSPEFGLDVVGIMDDEPKLGRIQGSGILGSVGDLQGAIHTHRIDTIIVAFSSMPDSEMTDLIRDVLSSGVTVWVIPRFYEFGIQDQRVEDLWGLPVIKLTPPGPARSEWRLKRAFDVIAAALGLVVAAPVIALSAALIWMESGRPVLFKQRRVGAHGHGFDILKLRTMAVCDEEVKDTEWAADGGRTTKIGKVLRASGLDELPQLVNVLRGEMSLVGPRPERPFFVEQFTPLYDRYAARHRVAGGITGWSQIRGLRGDTPISHRAAGDNYYIDTWSFARDLKIILRSVPTLIRGQDLQHLSDGADDSLVLQTTGELAPSSIDLSDSVTDDPVVLRPSGELAPSLIDLSESVIDDPVVLRTSGELAPSSIDLSDSAIDPGRSVGPYGLD